MNPSLLRSLIAGLQPGALVAPTRALADQGNIVAGMLGDFLLLAAAGLCVFALVLWYLLKTK